MRMSARAIKKFHERPHRDYSRWKDLSREELDRRMRRLPIRPPIWKRLKKDQQTCLVIGARKRAFAFFNETGTGKTFLSIALMAYFKRTGETKTNLVLVPNKINKYEWLEEGFKKHAPHMKCVVLQGSTEQKWKLIDDNPDADAFVETYAGFVRMVCTLKEVKRKRKGQTVEMDKLVPNKKLVQRCMKLFEGVYLDESTYVKNKAALPWRICNQLSKTANAFFILTATPFGRDVSDVWPQVFLVDRGETLGETMGLFRASFFEEKENYFGGYEYKLTKEAKKAVSRRLDNISIAYPADETEMPHLNRIPKYAVLDADAEQYYERAKEAMMIARKGEQMEMKNAFLRMRQISSGFVGFKDDEDGSRAKFIFEKNPKLDMLEALVTTFKPKHKFIVFHEFNYSADVISKKLKELGIKHVLINGMRKDGAAARDAFKNDPTVQALVLSNAAGGYGLNLQNAKYGIYYESPVGAILRKQTEKRFDRQFSLHKTVILYDLIVRGTVDQSILDFHAEGRSLWKAILNHGPRSIFKPKRREIVRERLPIAA
jgi:SNF2 family DNA or RNA helicase